MNKRHAIERFIDDLGRVSIPKEYRVKLGIKDCTKVNISLVNDVIVVKRIPEKDSVREAVEFLNSVVDSSVVELDGSTFSELKRHVYKMRKLMQ